MGGAWTEVACMDIQRRMHASAIHDRKVYIAGGYVSGYRNDMWAYDIDSDSWTQCASFTTQIGSFYCSGRTHFSASCSSGYLFIFGGYNSAYNELTHGKKYNIATDSWSDISSGASKRYGHTSVIYDDEMFIYGGFNDDGIYYKNDCWKYNITSDAWTEVACATTPRAYHTAALINDEMFIFSGATTGMELNDCWKYNITSDTWTEVACGATTRKYSKMVQSIDNKLIVFGGQAGGTNESLNDCWEYDATLGAWTEVACGAYKRYYHTAVCNSNAMYVFGGYRHESPWAIYSDMWRYDDIPPRFAYELGISSATAIQLIPEYDYKDGKKQIRSEHRSKSGRLRLYKWGEHNKIKFTTNYVPSSSAAIINSWWNSNTELLWFVTSGSATEVTSVMILNKEVPFQSYNISCDNLQKAVMQLESY